ncbi:transposase [Frigoribacterium sp. ACAM 257]|uniref:transposase n=1 Tax=Frigoribacterium sp. ACAM 257 TaxID=2508998 RepID=UPI0011B96ACF|nr:transposase [Frigoribacterium sp. ACAM 257]TWX34003.1 transposase [Frigoribacterium sp. ACAM 257]
MTLEEAAQQLYALPQQQFTAAREAQAAEAKSAGDAALATSVRALRRASASAWAVDLLARDAPDELEALASLGDRFRTAQSGGDRAAISALTRERKEALAGLVSRARLLASDAGHPLSVAALAEVDQTLRAVVADATAAAAVRSGRLVRALAADGLEEADLTDAVAGPAPEGVAPARLRAAPAVGGSSRDGDGDGDGGGGGEAGSGPGRRSAALDRKSAAEAARRAAEQAAADAEREADDAEAALAEVDERATRLAHDRDDVLDQLRRLRDEFAAAEHRSAELDDREKFLTREHRRAAADAAAARQAADRARAALD